MRILVRIAVAALVVFGISVAVLAVLLPRIVASGAAREQIENAAERLFGREVRYADLDIGLLPPSVIVRKPVVAASEAGSDPLLVADSISLRVAVLPLLTGTLAVDAVVVEGARVHLIRTPAGIEMPGLGGGGATDPGTGRDPLPIALRAAELRDATVRLDDRAVSPPVQWEVRIDRARLRGDALDEPFSVDAEATLASGGRVTLSGSAALDGKVDIVVKLDAVALGPLAPYVPGAVLTGSVSGEVEVRGPAANPERVRIEATFSDADLAVAGIAIVGSLRVDADLEGGIDAPAGAVSVDASAAAVRYGDIFAKPKGVPARLSGRLVSAQGAPLRLTGGKLRLRNLDARIDAELGKSPRVVANAPAFDVAGWQELVPALADIAPSGRVALRDLALTMAPLTVRGEIELLETTAKLPGQGDVVLRGLLVGEGDTIRSRDLQMIAGGQVVAIDLTVTDLAGAQRFSLRPKTQQADANRLVSSLSSQRDFLYGLLDFEGDLTGSMAAASPLATLDGRARLAIGDGRLKGISLLKLTLDELGAVGSVAALLGNVLTAGNLERFYGDDFISITGTFDVRNGVVHTRDLRLVHASYVVDLRGNIGLADRSIDMTGDITLQDDLDAMLASRLGGSPAGAGGVIPLARVTGTFDDPRVTVTPEVAIRFALAYGLRIPGLGRVDDALDGVLGRGTGRAVQGVLEGIFGKPKNRK